MANRLLLLLVLLPLAALAADEAEQPSLELLEFLGTWETKDGQWVDPTQLLEATEADTQAKQTEDQKHD